MAKCPKCERRKGKRPCPVLKADICETCCGTYRRKEIACTVDCPFFKRADRDLKERQIEKARKLEEQRKPIAAPEDRLMRLQLELERTACSRNRSYNDVTDHWLMAAAEEALKQVQEEPEGEERLPDEPTLEEMLALVLRQGAPPTLQDVTPDERQQAVQRLVASIKPYAAEGGGSRNYMELLANTVEARFGAWRTSDETLQAVRHLRAGRPLAAIDILERERNAKPNDASICHVLSQAYAQAGRHEDEFEAISRAVEINPANVDFLESMVVAAAETGRNCAAWNVAGKALDLNPPADARARLRDMHRRLGDAINEQLKARPHMDVQTLAQFEREVNAGFATARRGNVDEAEAHFVAAVEIDPNCADSRMLLGQVYMQTERLEQAKAQFAAALRSDPKREDAQQALAAVGQMLRDGGAAAPQEEPPQSGGRIIMP